MALNAYAALTANGTALTGEVSQQTIGGIDVSDDNLELFALEFGSALGEGRSPRSAGRREFEPIVFETRLGRSTPALFQALDEGHAVSGNIRLFDKQSDTGETRHYFTLEVDRAVVTSVRAISPDSLDPETADRLATVVVELAVNRLTYRDEAFNEEYSGSIRG